MIKSVKIDVESAIAHHKTKTGNDLSHRAIEKLTGVKRQTLAKWEQGESLKTLEGIAEVSDLTGYPIQKLIIIKK